MRYFGLKTNNSANKDFIDINSLCEMSINVAKFKNHSLKRFAI